MGVMQTHSKISTTCQVCYVHLAGVPEAAKGHCRSSQARVQEDGKLHIHNHLRFTILYHRDPETDLSRIVGFEVEPFSVKHKYDGKWNADRPELKTCNSNSMKFVSEKDTKQEVKEGEEIVFTYDVTFKVCTQIALQ